HSPSYGSAVVECEPVDALIEMCNRSSLPRVFEMGSLAASGDLAPLAHLSLPLIDEGDVFFEGKLKPAREVNRMLAWEPIHLRSKEGLALLNGTQFMTAYGVWALLHAHRLIRIANRVGALSLDVFDGRIEPFLPAV